MVSPISVSHVKASTDIKGNAPVAVRMEPCIMGYSNMTMKDLTALCKEKGIKGYSNKTKAELVEKVSSNDVIAVSAPDTELSTANTEAKTEAKTESKTEVKTEENTAKTEESTAKTEENTEKTEVKPEVKTEVKTEVKPEENTAKTESSTADSEKMSIDDLWASIVSNESARRTFNTRVEYILNQFGTALSCNRFAIGECIEYAATDLLHEIGVCAEAVSSEKRIDIRIRNVAGLTAISSKYVSTGSHVILYNAQRTVATDMTLHPTILFLANEWWLLVPSLIEKMGVSVKEYLKNTTDSVQLSFKILASLRQLNYPYYLTHAITYDKKSCPQKATSEVLYRTVKDLLDPHLDPIIRHYLETQIKLLHCRKI